MQILELDTPHGPARAHVDVAKGAGAGLILGHGAGGGVTAPDLVAATEAALAAGLSVALVEQPYRVAGRRSQAPARQLDAAWTAVCAHLQTRVFHGLPLVAGGRSAGARVACRTAGETGAVAVLCLAFPLVPSQRRGGAAPASRLPELDGVDVPTLVVQGERDRFGIPPGSASRTVVLVPGDHSLRTSSAAIGEAVRTWLADVLAR
jgi:uncharacterized protein